jgi:hypothetical protein
VYGYKLKYATRLLLKSVKKEREQKAWDIWLVDMELYKKNNKRSPTFEEYLSKIKMPQVEKDDTKQYDEIFEKAKKATERRRALRLVKKHIETLKQGD